MKTRSSKSKGRRLQTQLAEALSTRFGLTIEAVPPTRVGVRENGAGYIGEGCGGDLRIRRMGEAGLDVALLTDHARTVLAIDEKPCVFECKNTEEVRIGGANFWCERGADAVVRAAFKQLVAGGANPARQTLVVIVSRNRFPPLAIWYARIAPSRAHYDSGVETAYGRCFTMLFLDWLEELDGAIVPATRAESWLMPRALDWSTVDDAMARVKNTSVGRAITSMARVPTMKIKIENADALHAMLDQAGAKLSALGAAAQHAGVSMAAFTAAAQTMAMPPPITSDLGVLSGMRTGFTHAWSAAYPSTPLPTITVRITTIMRPLGATRPVDVVVVEYPGCDDAYVWDVPLSATTPDRAYALAYAEGKVAMQVLSARVSARATADVRAETRVVLVPPLRAARRIRF